MIDGEVQCRSAADAEAENVRLCDTEMLEQSDDIRCQIGAPERPVHVVGASMSLEVGGDDPASRREAGNQLAEL